MGAAYEVEELDLRAAARARRPFYGDWYTQPKKETETCIEQVREQRLSAAASSCRSGSCR